MIPSRVGVAKGGAERCKEAKWDLMHTKGTSREMIRVWDPQNLPDVWFVK